MAQASWLPSDNVTITGMWTFATGPALTTGATSTGATFTNPTIIGAVISGTVTVATGATFTNPTITGAVVSGTVTVASGATFTTPTVRYTAGQITSTGATGGAGTALSVVTPAVYALTGASGTAIDIATGAGVAGASYDLRNVNTTGVITVYAVGGTINGTTGTSGLALSPTGTKSASLVCTTTGAWQVIGISTT
jgi:hypothetical protein